MSEMIDNILYNFYDYVKSIYIYSHLKTNLIDIERQKIELYTNILLLILSLAFIIVSAFKILVIIFYFIFIQAFSAFITFIIAIFKTRLKINFCSSFKNALSYLGKVFRRIYTFNFYVYGNIYIGFIMIFSYFFFLLSSSFFYLENKELIEQNEKPGYYMVTFYCHFESIILIQLLCSSFYASRNMKLSTLIALGLFMIMNIMLALGYCITKIIEDCDGSYEYDEPQGVMNIIFNSILFFLNSISLFNIIVYNKNGKFA
jgi:hypothetical protein